MKKILIFIVMLFIIGCELSSSSSKPFTKERLINHSFYTINDCYDEIVEYKFNENNYNKIFYEDESFGSILKNIYDKIDYLNDLEITLYEGNLALDCSVVDDNSDGNLELYCINKEYKDKDGYYHTKRTLYTTKELAIKNKNRDCQ